MTLVTFSPRCADVTRAAPADLTLEPGPGQAESLADIIEWLFLVFEGRLGLTAVLAIVEQCCRELDVDADTTALARLERIAYERLAALANEKGIAPTSPEPIRMASRNGPRELFVSQLD